jgi:glutaredoxin
MGLRFLFRKPRRRPELQVVMYTRAGCHLCDDAWAILQQSQRAYGFTLESHDIDRDPALAAQYGNCVPVVTVAGKLRFRGRINPELLRRLLNAGGDPEAE